jgi:hypothetical protein
MEALGRIPDYMRQPEAHLQDIHDAYLTLQIDAKKLKEFLNLLRGDSPRIPVIKNYALTQSAYAVTVVLLVLANVAMRAFEPWNLALEQEASVWEEEILTLGENALHFRPLGASYMPMFLGIIWASTSEPERKTRVEDYLAMYQSDFPSIKWLDYSRQVQLAIISLHERAQHISMDPDLLSVGDGSVCICHGEEWRAQDFCVLL